MAARCAHARAGVGVVASQNITDPSLGPQILDQLGNGADAAQALASVLQGTPYSAYRQVLADVAPGTGYPRFLPMQLQLNDALGSERLLSSMTVFFSSVALVLCGAATLTLLMMRVKQSIPEIAIRVALGATPLHAAGMVLREMVLLIVVGTAIGGLSLRGVEYVTNHYLHFGHSIAMSDVFGAICLLAGMTLSAGGIPALRAATLQPMPVMCRDS